MLWGVVQHVTAGGGKHFYVMYIGYNPYCNFKLKDILSIQDECKFRLHLTAGISLEAE